MLPAVIVSQSEGCHVVVLRRVKEAWSEAQRFKAVTSTDISTCDQGTDTTQIMSSHGQLP